MRRYRFTLLRSCTWLSMALGVPLVGCSDSSPSTPTALTAPQVARRAIYSGVACFEDGIRRVHQLLPRRFYRVQGHARRNCSPGSFEREFVGHRQPIG
jgi:hypothetical protein